jgi:hypothetical protein
VRLRLLERFGRAIGFSPEGRSVRGWVRGHPGADETEVVPGTIESVRPEGAAVLRVREADGLHREVLAVPREPGWGLQAMWFSFIAVDVYELDEEGAEAAGEPLARWFIRLGEAP